MRPILLIEDNPMDLDLTMEAFAHHNVTNPVEVCRDGEEALRYIDSHQDPRDERLPVVVLLDLRLPKADGTDVLRRARQDDVWSRIPFVVLTTSREALDVESAYRLGANSYIVKPVDFLAFVGAIATIKAYWLGLNESPFPSVETGQ